MINLLRKKKVEKNCKNIKPISIIKENRAYEHDIMILCAEKSKRPFLRNKTYKTASETSLAKFFENVQGLIK